MSQPLAEKLKVILRFHMRHAWEKATMRFRKCYPGTDLPVLSKKELAADGFRRLQSDTEKFIGLVYHEQHDWLARFEHSNGQVNHLDLLGVQIAGTLLTEHTQNETALVEYYAAIKALERKKDEEEERANRVVRFPPPRPDAAS